VTAMNDAAIPGRSLVSMNACFILCIDSKFSVKEKLLKKTFQDVTTDAFQFQCCCGKCYVYNSLIIL